MPTITVKVHAGVSAWSYGDLTLRAVGEHEVDVTDQPGLAAAVAAACDAGALDHVSGRLPASAVQSQEEGEKAYAKANDARQAFHAERDAALAAFGPGDAEGQAEALAEYERISEEAAQAALEP